MFIVIKTNNELDEERIRNKTERKNLRYGLNEKIADFPIITKMFKQQRRK